MASTRARRRGSVTRPARDPEVPRPRPEKYILVKPTVSATATDPVAAAETPPRFDLLVLGALQASLTMFVSQAATSVLIANATTSTVKLSFAAGFIPHVAVNATPSNLMTLNTWPPTVAVVATCTGVLWNLWRRRDTPMFVLGWGAGLLMALNLLVIQFVRHLVEPPMLSPWMFAQAVAFVVAAGLIFLAYRPTGTDERSLAMVPARSKTARARRPQR